MRAVVKVWFEVEATTSPGVRICRSLMSRTPTSFSRGWAATVSDRGVAASGASRRWAVTTISDTWVGPSVAASSAKPPSAKAGAAKTSRGKAADARHAARKGVFMGGMNRLAERRRKALSRTGAAI
ncbi:hypothetical protein D3C87_1497020 [compost metagenome]